MLINLGEYLRKVYYIVGTLLNDIRNVKENFLIMVMARYLETRQCKSFISKVSRVIVFALLSHVWHTEASTKGQNPNNSPSILTRICGDTTSDMGRVRFEGAISDCSCEFDSVNNAVLSFFNPLLGLLTSSAYFRYFRVDLERPCPFWHEDAQCMMEGCSVCTCDENEVPRAWIDDFIADMDRKRMDFVPPDAIKDHGDSSISTSTSPASTSTSSSLPSSSSYRLSSNPSSENSQSTVKERNGYGWITPPASAFGGYDDTGRGTLNSSLSNLRKPLLEMDSTKKGYLNFLRQSEYDNGEDEDDMDWTDMAEDKCGGGGGRRKNVGMGKNDNDHGGGPVYVNLLQNPEGYTGYAGPSAQRVWQAIQQENCFGGGDDICLEKRVFYRLMSGLQASISTHIAKNYYFPDGTWGINLPLFMRAVGSHSDRMNNLYFTFLFVLRAVVKGGPILIEQQFYTGNSTEDKEIRLMVQKLVSARLRDDEEHIGSGSSKGIIVNEQFKDVLEGLVVGVKNAGGDTVDQCRNGFDESVLFQMPLPAPLFYANPSSYQYMSAKEEFRLRFR